MVAAFVEIADMINGVMVIGKQFIRVWKLFTEYFE